jgi:hypothetical protein
MVGAIADRPAPGIGNQGAFYLSTDETPPDATGPGTWFFATPVAPATAPAGASSGVAFANGWGNVALSDGSYSPLMYRTEPGGARIVGAIGGGAFGAAAVVLPAGFTPTADIAKVCAGIDNQSALLATINPAGFLTPVGPAGAGMQLLYSQVLASPQASIDTGTGGVAQTATHLWIKMLLISTTAAAATIANVTVNNDSGANYDLQRAAAQNVSSVFASSLAQTSWQLNIHGAAGSTGYASDVDFWINNYTGTTYWKTGHGFDGIMDATAANLNLVRRHIGYRSTSAITRLAVTAAAGNLAAGSGMWIYGL